MRPRVHLATPPADDLLAIHVRDHLAAAVGGVALARRAVGTARTSAHAELLARLAEEIQDDLAALRRCADALGVPRSRARELAALAAERLGRLKLNGQLRGSSPLSPVIELQGLLLGVTGKASCWRVLALSGVEHLLPDDIDLGALEARALGQRRELEQLHREVATRAVGGAGAPSLLGGSLPR
jgi:hypothetical protein